MKQVFDCRIVLEFLDACFHLDPSDRPSADSLLQMAFANVHVRIFLMNVSLEKFRQRNVFYQHYFYLVSKNTEKNTTVVNLQDSSFSNEDEPDSPLSP